MKLRLRGVELFAAGFLLHYHQSLLFEAGVLARLHLEFELELEIELALIFELELQLAIHLELEFAVELELEPDLKLRCCLYVATAIARTCAFAD